MQPTPAELLRAALEKIVFFEWRLSELSAELAKAETRAAHAESELGRAEDDAREQARAARAARAQAAELEAERARLATLLARPAHVAQPDLAALEAERERAARAEARLADARRDLERARTERERWLNELIEQARSGDESPAALAQFISELRGEVISLRERQKKTDALLAAQGVEVPAPAEPAPVHMPAREAGPVEEARKLWAEGRLAQSSAAPIESGRGVAARALVEQCLKSLAAADPARREQAARHLAAVALPSAAPGLARALHAERDAKVRAQLVRALTACGGEGAADVAAQLQHAAEPPLVRLAALETLCALPGRARDALEVATLDAAPAVRRRAAALAAEAGHADLLTRFATDADASVRAATEAAQSAAPAPEAPPAEEPAAPAAPVDAPDPARDAVQAVQAAIFGLTEDELAARIGLEPGAARALADSLVARGAFSRRGRRLVAAAEAT